MLKQKRSEMDQPKYRCACNLFLCGSEIGTLNCLHGAACRCWVMERDEHFVSSSAVPTDKTQATTNSWCHISTLALQRKFKLLHGTVQRIFIMNLCIYFATGAFSSHRFEFLNAKKSTTRKKKNRLVELFL